jgi:PIN domain
MEISKYYLFLDTNIYLQYRDFDQIDWPKVVGSDAVCLIAPPEVLTELDKFKYDTLSERRKRRSRAITKKLSEIMFSVGPDHEVPVPGRSGVWLWGPTDSADTAKYSGLVSTISDDQIIAAVLKFIEDHPKIAPHDVLFVSEDNGPLNKARARDIPIFRPVEDLRLPDEPSQDQQKLDRLQRKLEEIESNQPKLELPFDDAGKTCTELDYQIQIGRALDDDEISVKLQDEAKAIAWPQPAKQTLDRSSQKPASVTYQETLITAAMRSLEDTLVESMKALATSPFLQVPSSEIERYTTESAKYLVEFKEYLLELAQFQRLDARERRIELLVANSGTLPAIGVIVRVIFPDNLEIRKPTQWSEAPEPPDRPIQPRLAGEMLTLNLSMPRIAFPALDAFSGSPLPVDPDASGPSSQSGLNDWVKMLQLDARISCREAPIDSRP